MGLLRDVTRSVLKTLVKAVDDDEQEDQKTDPPQAPAPAAVEPDDDVVDTDAEPLTQGADSTHEDEGDEAPSPGGLIQTPNQQPGAMVGAAQLQKPQTPEQLEQALSDPKSLFWDPFAIIDALGYKDKPTSLTFDTLKSMTWRMPIIQAMILTRLRQVSNFAVPQQDKYSTGFRIALRDKKARPTPVSEARSQQLEKFILTTGATDNPAGRDDFTTFLQKVVRDSLTYDQLAFEIVPDRMGKPAEFYAVDGRTIRIADTTKLFIDPEDRKIARYVQIYDGLVIAEYTSDELCFGVRNPTTDIRNQGYGQAEMEMLVVTVTAMLWAWDYNQKFFSQGTSAKGIINFKGAIPDKQLRQFRRHWYSMAAGVENSFKTPIVNADEMQWVNLMQSNRDMEFSAWMDFLIKVASAIYGLDPMEINFKYGDSGQKSMFESANASKLAASKDKGLKPLLQFLQKKINQHLIFPLDPEYTFEFVGLDSSTPAEQADLNKKLAETYKTVNEIRAEEDMPPLPDGTGDIILNPVYMQHLNMVKQSMNPSPDPNNPMGGGPSGGAGGDSPFPPDGPDGGNGDAPKMDDSQGMHLDDRPSEPAEPAKPPEEASSEKSFRKIRETLKKSGAAPATVVVDIEL